MCKRKKIEVIPFKDFMSRPATTIQMKKPHTPILYSLVPGMSIEGFFDMSPEVATAYALVLGVGGLGILAHITEVNAAKVGFESISRVIDRVMSIGLPLGTYSFILWVLYKIMG